LVRSSDKCTTKVRGGGGRAVGRGEAKRKNRYLSKRTSLNTRVTCDKGRGKVENVPPKQIARNGAAQTRNASMRPTVGGEEKAVGDNNTSLPNQLKCDRISKDGFCFKEPHIWGV